MLDAIKLLFGKHNVWTQTVYPLKNLKHMDLDIQFSDVHEVIVKCKGHQTLINGIMYSVNDVYEIKRNKPNVLTMIIYSSPGIDVNVSFDKKNGLIHIKKREAVVSQEEGNQSMIARKKIEMINIRKYKAFCIH